VIVKTNKINRKALGTSSLMIATFLNPLGYDILVYKLTQLTKDYWITMFVLYICAFLSFISSFISFKIGNKFWGNILITFALFLNPFGYDIVVYMINLVFNDYWLTMIIMYVLAGLFFSLSLYFYNINPIRVLKYNLIKLNRKINRKNG
jgi:hypothetical protein